ncbi:MAG: hypothetical protein ACRDNT_21910 [Streptosporangiaceae bacterium]
MSLHLDRPAAGFALLALALAGCAGAAGEGHSSAGKPAAPAASAVPGRVFPPLAAAAPASWPRLTLPDRTAVLAYPPSMHPVAGDKDAVSAARRDPAGAYLLYLNATPRQGAESLRGWAAFRLGLLRSDDAASARQDAAATGVSFRGGTGSCVLDDYITKTGVHHYREIACLVQGRTGASVIVAAAPAAQWAQAGPLLEQAVAAYQVR